MNKLSNLNFSVDLNNKNRYINNMKIKILKLDVYGCNGENVSLNEEYMCDESKFSFKIEDKEMEGGDCDSCNYIFIREDSEYFKMSGEEIIDNEIDCKISEKNNYNMKLDDYYEEINEIFEKVS